MILYPSEIKEIEDLSKEYDTIMKELLLGNDIDSKQLEHVTITLASSAFQLIETLNFYKSKVIGGK